MLRTEIGCRRWEKYKTDVMHIKGLIAELIVGKNARCGGVGTMLLNEIEKYFKSIKCEYSQIDVFAPNENAKRFYYKNGYQDRMKKL